MKFSLSSAKILTYIPEFIFNIYRLMLMAFVLSGITLNLATWILLRCKKQALSINSLITPCTLRLTQLYALLFSKFNLLYQYW